MRPSLLRGNAIALTLLGLAILLAFGVGRFPVAPAISRASSGRA